MGKLVDSGGFPRPGLLGNFWSKLGPFGYIESNNETVKGWYFVSSFDPLAGKLKDGQLVRFTGDNPNDHRNVARDVELLGEP